MLQPRKQAQQARSHATQAAVVEAAARILEEQGQDGLTTNAVARRAGVSIGSLYQYFPNKAAILASLIRAKRAELLDKMRGAMASADQMPADQAVDVLIRAGMMHQFSRPGLALELETLAPHLSLDAETTSLAEEMAGLILGTVQRLDANAGLQEARDVIAICKGLITAEAQAGNTGGASLTRRARRAVLGYLDFKT